MHIEPRGICRVASLIGLLVVLELSAAAEEPDLCQKFGPQSPRDITQPDGTNRVVFSPAPPPHEMTLCNVHFHVNAEHKGPGYSQFVGPGEFEGFACDDSGEPAGDAVCRNVRQGNTVEFHYVFTTCDVDVEPGRGLDACSSATCGNPQLRVEAQVFRVEAGFGDDLSDAATIVPAESGIVSYLGSTTGPDFSAEDCSPLQVTWSVRPQCRPLGIDRLAQWCERNRFNEDHGHGVRALVTALSLLSKIGD